MKKVLLSIMAVLFLLCCILCQPKKSEAQPELTSGNWTLIGSTKWCKIYHKPHNGNDVYWTVCDNGQHASVSND